MEFIREVLNISNVKIPINVPLIGKDEINAVLTVLKEGNLTTAANLGGKNVQEFEKLASSFVKSKFAIAEWAASSVLSIPIHPKVTSKNLQFIAKNLRQAL